MVTGVHLALWNGQNWEDAGDYVKALACYAPAEKVVDTESKAREAILRSAFIQFDNGNTAEAFRLVQVLAQSAQKGKIPTSEQVGNVIVLAKDAALAQVLGQLPYNWWPQWQQTRDRGRWARAVEGSQGHPDHPEPGRSGARTRHGQEQQGHEALL